MAYARRKRTSSVGRSLVDQLLQELDAIGADNQQVLILAATNAPWDLDDALLRPTTLEWLDRAQSYVEFANQDKRYDEVALCLRSREVRRCKW